VVVNRLMGINQAPEEHYASNVRCAKQEHTGSSAGGQAGTYVKAKYGQCDEQ
jgi:hypothetical protein